MNEKQKASTEAQALFSRLPKARKEEEAVDESLFEDRGRQLDQLHVAERLEVTAATRLGRDFNNDSVAHVVGAQRFDLSVGSAAGLAQVHQQCPRACQVGVVERLVEADRVLGPGGQLGNQRVAPILGRHRLQFRLRAEFAHQQHAVDAPVPDDGLRKSPRRDG